MGHEHYIGAAQTFEIINTDDSRPDVVLLKVFYIDDTVNINNWQATWEGLKQDAKDIPGIPLVLQEDLQHPKFSVQQYFDRGTVYDYEIDEVNKKIIVYVRITDKTIVERIKSGELQYVSPAVIPRGSEYLKKRNGIDILERTIPIHLAIVGEPAYGPEKAKMTYLCSGDAKECDHRLRIMTAAKNIYDSADDCVSKKIQIIKRERPNISNEQAAAIAYSMCREGKTADHSSDGIKSDLKFVSEGIPALEQIPLIKKMLAKTARIASVLDKERFGMEYHMNNGVEGYWINAKDTDVFIARNQSIEAAINTQCGCCTKTAAKIQTTKEAANYRDTDSKTINCVNCKYFNEKESSCSVVKGEILAGHVSDLYQGKKFQAGAKEPDDPNIESWITVKGNHIPIKKNQTKEEAVKEFLEKKDDSKNNKRKEVSQKQVNIDVKSYPSSHKLQVEDSKEIWNKLDSNLRKNVKHFIIQGSFQENHPNAKGIFHAKTGELRLIINEKTFPSKNSVSKTREKLKGLIIHETAHANYFALSDTQKQKWMNSTNNMIGLTPYIDKFDDKILKSSTEDSKILKRIRANEMHSEFLKLKYTLSKSEKGKFGAYQDVEKVYDKMFGGLK